MVTTTLARLSSGIPGLDIVLGGGFIEGASYILRGHPGAGKTIAANQIAFSSASRGMRVLYVTLLAETHDRLFQALSTLDYFDKQRLGKDITYVSVFQTLRDEGLAEVVTLLRKEIARTKAKLLVFDGLLNARDRADSHLDIKTFVAEIQSQAAFFGCSVLFLTSTATGDDCPEHTMVDGVIEFREELVGVRTLRRLQVRKSRGSASLGGFHQYDITNQGVRVFPRLESCLVHRGEEVKAVEGTIESGVKGLDRLLGDGFPRGSVTLLLGPTGTCKTSIGIGFLSKAKADDPGLHFGFYETPARLVAKSKALGVDLQHLIDRRHLEVIWQPMGENILDKLAHRLLDAVRARKVKRLVIDGLKGFERAAAAEPRLVEFLATLANELRALGVTTIATWELNDIVGPTLSAPNAEVSSLLDNLVVLRNVELKSEFKRIISVLKVRDHPSIPMVHQVFFGKEGVEVGSPMEPVANAITGVATPLDT